MQTSTVSTVAFDVATLADAIVVGYDGAPHSQAALCWAAARAHRDGSRLVLLGTYGSPTSLAYTMSPSGAVMQEFAAELQVESEALRESLSAAAADMQALYPELDLRCCAINDTPQHALEEASRHASLLVLGTRRREGTDLVLLGSVSEDMVRRATCPVAVIPAGTVLPSAVGPVVVGVDDSETSQVALQRAASEAAAAQEPLLLLQTYRPASGQGETHLEEDYSEVIVSRFGVETVGSTTHVVIDNPPSPEGPRSFTARMVDPHVHRATDDDFAYQRDRIVVEQLTARADALVADLAVSHPNLRVVRAIHPGAAHEVLNEASEGASLVVVGSRGLGWWRRLFTKSTSREVMLHADSPVMVVPPAAAR